jgi:hypothetical protein
MVVTSLAAGWVLRLWEMNHRVPLNVEGDAPLAEMLIKSLVDNPWYQHNSHLGAPLGETLYDFPGYTGDHLQLIALKVMTVFTGSVGTIINAYYLASFPLVALVAFLVLRRLLVSRPAAFVCASLYSLLAYHFLRGEGHLFLSMYVAAPVGALLALRVAANQPLVERDPLGRGVRAWLGARTLKLIAVCVVIGMTGSYFAVFTILLVLAAYFVRGLAGSWRPSFLTVVVIVGAIGVTLTLNNVPNLIYRAQHGANPIAGVRTPQDTEHYALKLTELLMPIVGHRIPALALLRSDYEETAPPGPSESSFAALGTIASLAFVYLGLVGLAAMTGGSRARRRPELLRNAAMLTFVAFLLGTLGGISSFIAYLITPQLHAWNRISTFIAFYAFLAVAMALDRVRAHLGRRTRTCAVVLAAVLLLGALDQTSDSFIPAYQANLATWGSTAAYDLMIEHTLPRGANVFELPIVPFPEGAPPTPAVGSYDNALPYLQSTGLNWSFGVVEGRPSDWQAALAQVSPAQVVNAAELTGFQGLSIDRLAYPGGGQVAVAQVSQVLGEAPVLSRNSRFAFFDLRAHARRALAGLTPAQLRGQREIVLHPLPVVFGPGFFPLEAAPNESVRWQGLSATIMITNTSTAPRQLSFSAIARTGFPRPSHVTVTAAGAPTLRFDANRSGHPFTFNFTLGPGSSTLTISTDAPRVRAAGEHRDVHLEIAEAALSG